MSDNSVLVMPVSNEKTMTVKEIAAAINAPAELVRRHVRKLFPDLMQSGKVTVLNEEQVTAISRSVKSDYSISQSNRHTSHDSLPTTELELMQNAALVLKQLTDRIKVLESEQELLKARVAISDSFRTVDRYMQENNITVEWCQQNNLGKGYVGVGIKLSRWFKALPPERQQGAVTEINLGKYMQKSYRMDILDEYFDVDN